MSEHEQIQASAVRGVHEVRTWDRETDVIVVGLGCAGACAAVEAAEAGAEVLVLERSGGGGGTSAMSGGLIYMGGGTPVQEACGYADTVEGMQTFLSAACGPEVDTAKVEVFCAESVAHFHWLEAHGVPFKRSFYPEPSMEAPTDDCLVFSGGEDAHPFAALTPPVPRAHKPRHPNAAGGFLMQCLVAATEKSGAAVVTDARADTLIVEGDGRVAGVVVRHDGTERCIRARRGVVLTAGGFINDPEMVRRLSPLLARCSFKLGVPGDDGRAIRMAMGAGADVIRMHAGEVAIPITPPRRLVRGILVTAAGQRFINEDAYYGRVGQEGLFRHDGRMFFIHDTATYERSLAGFEATYVEETIAGLERSSGLPTGSLQATVALYNQHAAAGRDPLFHKHPQFLQPLTQAPFAAIDCSTDKVLWATFTLGGLRTRPSGAVLTPDGAAIPGLYAAGRTTSGIAAYGYVSGISLGDGTFFGRRAGRTAARHG
jgi:3-oxo-5alpha-steroid 4-dehydrogenase